jgi:hypothetical protein
MEIKISKVEFFTTMEHTEKQSDELGRPIFELEDVPNVLVYFEFNSSESQLSGSGEIILPQNVFFEKGNQITNYIFEEIKK